MTELEMQSVLFEVLHQSVQLLKANYTPVDWWECDLFAILKNRRWIEFEIKRSAGDLLNDRNKSRQWKYVDRDGVKQHCKETKHEALENSSPVAPSRFFFVIPKWEAASMMHLIPYWAGLIVIDKSEEYEVGFWKPAPLIHTKTIGYETYRHAMRYSCFQNKVMTQSVGEQGVKVG